MTVCMMVRLYTSYSDGRRSHRVSVSHIIWLPSAFPKTPMVSATHVCHTRMAAVADALT